MMLLCMDVGNTNIVLGVFEDELLTHSFRIKSDPMETPDEYGIKIIEMLRFVNVDYQKITGVIIASVVPGLDGGFEKTFDKFFGIKPIFVSPGIKSGIKIKIDNPKQLGRTYWSAVWPLIINTVRLASLLTWERPLRSRD